MSGTSQVRRDRPVAPSPALVPPSLGRLGYGRDAAIRARLVAGLHALRPPAVGLIAKEQTAVEMMRLALAQRNDRRHRVVVRARALLQAAASGRLQLWRERAWAAEARLELEGDRELLAIDTALSETDLDENPSIAARVVDLIQERELYRSVLANLVSRHPELVNEVLTLRSELRDAMAERVVASENEDSDGEQ